MYILISFHFISGKSTVAALLERFYDPQEGAILLDGHPLSSLDPSWVRGELAGYIHQEPVLFATSVMENIRYGRPSATDEEVSWNPALLHEAVWLPLVMGKWLLSILIHCKVIPEVEYSKENLLPPSVGIRGIPIGQCRWLHLSVS